MTDHAASLDPEFSAMDTLYRVLEPLDDDARSRVFNYIANRLEINTSSQFTNNKIQEAIDEESESSAFLNLSQPSVCKYDSMAELYDAANPTNNADKALVAGYWLQICGGKDTFNGQAANSELKHLGHQVTNITDAINQLKSRKPALTIQVKKSGKSQQARKLYKLTKAGQTAVEEMLRG